MSGEERRRWKRLRHELPLQLQVVGSEHSLPATGSHMNPEGIFVRVPQPPELGSRVRVTLNAEATNGILTSEGEVVDRVAPGTGGDRPPGVGIQFDSVGPAWHKLYNHLRTDD